MKYITPSYLLLALETKDALTASNDDNVVQKGTNNSGKYIYESSNDLRSYIENFMK